MNEEAVKTEVTTPEVKPANEVAKEILATAEVKPAEGTTIATPATTGAATVTTPAPEPAKPEEPKIDPKQFAAMARKEKELIQERKAMKEFHKETELTVREHKEIVEQFKTDPLGAVNRLAKKVGVEDAYQVLTDQVLNNGKPTTDPKVKKLEEKVDVIYNQLKSKIDAEENVEIQKRVDDFKTNINKFIDTNEKHFPTISAMEEKDLVFQVIEEHLIKTQRETGVGELMEIEDAAKLVEGYLKTKIDKGAAKLGYSRQAQVTTAPPEDKKANEVKEEKQERSETLTNALASQPSGTGTTKRMSRQERLKVIADKYL